MLWPIEILALPVGLLIAHACKDELKQGRAWFKRIIFFGILVCVGFALYGAEAASLTSLFLSIIALISLLRSYYV